MIVNAVAAVKMWTDQARGFGTALISEHVADERSSSIIGGIGVP
jgi:hypothetical protein